MVGFVWTLIVTVELEVAQALPFEMVQRNTYVPGINPVTEVVANTTEVKVAVLGPETWVQFPIPIVGTLAPMWATVPQTSWVGPAFDVEGGS